MVILSMEKMTMKSTTTAETTLTINELAERLKIHPVTLRGLYRRKAIPGMKLGHRTLRFDYAQVVNALTQANQATAQTK